MRRPSKLIMGAAVFALTAASSAYAIDRDNNPPGPRGGPGTNWENPPGPRGGPGTSPNRRLIDRDNNPPGPRGGPGTNWENPPGPRGGVGASPDVRYRHTAWLRGHMTPAEWNVFVGMPIAKRYTFCQKRNIHKDYCWVDRDDNPPGPIGGPGTNWENPPGPVGGPGASPDRR
jgi:hypothetical protein